MEYPTTSIKLDCCACAKSQLFSDDTKIYDSGWLLHEQGGKRIDLCPKCRKRQDGMEEQESQIRGNPPKLISALMLAGDAENAKKVADDVYNNVGESRLRKSVSRETSGVEVKAVFKLVSINVRVGDTMVKGKNTDAVDIDSCKDGNDFVKGKLYFKNLK